MTRRFRRAPRPTGPCPPWCQSSHTDDDDGVRLHSRDVSDDVAVIATDDDETGTRCGPEIVIRACSGDTTRWARQVALAILEASDLLDGGR